MKNTLLFALFLAIFLPLSGQEDDPIEKLMTRRFLSCADIQYNASYLIPQYYERGDKDTIQAILTFWENRCSTPEEIIRCKIVLAIDDGTFTEDLYDDHIFNLLYRYRQSLYYNYQNYRHIIDLNKFTNNLSIGLLALRKDLSPVENFFLHWYSDDFDRAIKMLDSYELNGTKLQEIHFRSKKEYEQLPFGHWDFIAGVWIPHGNLDIVGVHPFLGIRGGFKCKKITIDATMGFKFLKSPDTYQVYKNDVIWDTRHFFGGYIGLDAAYRLLTTGESGFDLIGGIAWDGFDALDVKKDGSDDKITKSINSLNLNIGIGYKFHFNDTRYLGIDCKYNFVNYKNSGGTNLDGNAFSINLIFGGFSRGNRYRTGYW